MSEWSAREWSSVLSIFCIAGMLWRSIPYWTRMTLLEQALTGITAMLLLVSVVGSLHLDRLNAPPSGVLPYSIGVKVALLFVIWKWPKWVGKIRLRSLDVGDHEPRH